MKKWIAVGIFGILMMALAKPALGQAVVGGTEPANSTKSLPGYVEFDLLDALGGKKPNVSVFLEGAMLKMAAAAASEANTPITTLLEQLRLVQVKVFEDMANHYQNIRPVAEAKIADLKENGWTPAVSVPEENETVDVLVKSSNDFIQGLLVLVMEEDEVVFVNVAGDIDPVVMGSLLGSLGAGVFTGDVDFEDLLFPGMEEEVEEVYSEDGEAVPSEGASESEDNP